MHDGGIPSADRGIFASVWDVYLKLADVFQCENAAFDEVIQ
jgi:hypothetical protein